MKKIITVLLGALLGTVLGLPLAAPASAHSTWKPTLVPLTSQVQSEAYNSQHFDCYYYESGISIGTPRFQAFYLARCNPRDTRAKALGKTYPVEYRKGLRTGWCMRWLGLSPIGTKVSTSCIKTVRHIYYTGNVIA